jgi:hypothetical protein
MIFYHGTTTARLGDILVDGLVPQTAHDNIDRTCIYLTNNLSIAELYADLAAIRRGGNGVVVEMDDQHLPSHGLFHNSRLGSCALVANPLSRPPRTEFRL